MNLDPFNEYSDDEIWDALEQVNMRIFIQNLNNQLLFECSEHGANLRFKLFFLFLIIYFNKK